MNFWEANEWQKTEGERDIERRITIECEVRWDGAVLGTGSTFLILFQAALKKEHTALFLMQRIIYTSLSFKGSDNSVFQFSDLAVTTLENIFFKLFISICYSNTY